MVYSVSEYKGLRNDEQILKAHSGQETLQWDWAYKQTAGLQDRFLKDYFL